MKATHLDIVFQLAGSHELFSRRSFKIYSDLVRNIERLLRAALMADKRAICSCILWAEGILLKYADVVLCKGNI
jgi:hypothetical protein